MILVNRRCHQDLKVSSTRRWYSEDRTYGYVVWVEFWLPSQELLYLEVENCRNEDVMCEYIKNDTIRNDDIRNKKGVALMKNKMR